MIAADVRYGPAALLEKLDRAIAALELNLVATVVIAECDWAVDGKAVAYVGGREGVRST